MTPAQRKRAKELLARDRGIGVESITDASIEFALAAGTIKMADIDSVSSYSAPLDTGSSSSYDGGSSSSYDSGSYGSGCDS